MLLIQELIFSLGFQHYAYFAVDPLITHNASFTATAGEGEVRMRAEAIETARQYIAANAMDAQARVAVADEFEGYSRDFLQRLRQSPSTSSSSSPSFKQWELAKQGEWNDEDVGGESEAFCARALVEKFKVSPLPSRYSKYYQVSADN